MNTTTAKWFVPSSKVAALARVAFVVIVYWLILTAVDVRSLNLSGSEVVIALAGAICLIIVQVIICNLRWRWLARDHTSKVPGFWFSFAVYIEGLFYNQVVPSPIVGDGVRIFRWRSRGVPLGAATASVVLDRLSGVNGAALFALFLILGFGLPAELGWARNASLGLVLLVLCGSAFAFIAPNYLVRLPLDKFDRARWIIDHLRRTITPSKTFFFSLLVSVAGHAVGATATVCLAVALDIEVGATTVMCLSGLVVLVTILPISFGGWGLRELTFLTLLTPLGAQEVQALALGFLLGLANLITALPGGLGVFGFGMPRPVTGELSLGDPRIPAMGINGPPRPDRPAPSYPLPRGKSFPAGSIERVL